MIYIDLYYCDESHFELTPCLAYAWLQKHSPILLPAAKGKRLSVSGLMTPDCKLLSRTFRGYKLRCSHCHDGRVLSNNYQTNDSSY